MSSYGVSVEDQEALLKEGLTEEQIQRVLRRVKTTQPEVPTPTQEDELDRLIRQQSQLELRRGGDVGTMMGWLTIQEMIEDRRERRTLKANPPPAPQPQSSPEIKALESKVGELTSQLSKLIEDQRRKTEEDTRQKEMSRIEGKIEALSTEVKTVKTIPPPRPEEETSGMKDLREKLSTTLKKVEDLDKALQAKEFEGMKTGLLTQIKSDLEPIKVDLSRMHGRFEEYSTGKGTTDRAMARELKMLGMIDQRLAGIEGKLPTATEASELVRQMQPPQVRTTPPRTETEKATTYREAIQKLEEKEKKPEAKAKPEVTKETKK